MLKPETLNPFIIDMRETQTLPPPPSTRDSLLQSAKSARERAARELQLAADLEAAAARYSGEKS